MWNYNENGDRNKLFLGIILRAIVFFALMAVGLVGCPRYKVYYQQMQGQSLPVPSRIGGSRSRKRKPTSKRRSSTLRRR